MTTDPGQVSAAATLLPAGLPLLRLALSYTLDRATRLPVAKGSMVRGGFGHALQRIGCSEDCWKKAAACATASCVYHQLCEPRRAPGSGPLADQTTLPRPYVFQLPDDPRQQFARGDTLAVGLTLIGSATIQLPQVVLALIALGRPEDSPEDRALKRLGIGEDHAPATLARAAALDLDGNGTAIVSQGIVLQGAMLPQMTTDDLVRRAATLPPTLRLVCETPLRLKEDSKILGRFSVTALTRALLFRLTSMAAAFCSTPWWPDHQHLVALATQVRVADDRTRWVERARISNRTGDPQTVELSGLVGSVLLQDVPPALRALLLTGSFVHAGKGTTAGNGQFRLKY